MPSTLTPLLPSSATRRLAWAVCGATAVLTLATLTGCGSPGGTAALKATARLEPTRGNKVMGVVTFLQEGDRVYLQATVSGLKPGQAHGFHLHEVGDCSSGDGMSTGGHFNPLQSAHGPQDSEHHAGDLPSLQADASGMADVKFRVKGLTVAPGPSSVLGRGLIVHAEPDDYVTQPTGNSGARVACGVVN
ncbi:MAG: superoxide dismutase family protein [Pseudomonadota bacterium]